MALSNKINLKILYLGLTQSNFIDRIAYWVRKDNPKVIIDVGNYIEMEQSKPFLYDNLHHFTYERKSKLKTLLAFLRIIPFKITWIHLLNGNLSIKKLKSDMFYLTSLYYISKKLNRLDYNLFHIHSCREPYLKFLYYIPKRTRVLVSFWGLDLFQPRSKFDLKIQNWFFKKVSGITLHGNEMEVVLKQTRKIPIQTKIHQVLIPMDTSIIDNIDSNPVLNTHTRINVCIGYNSHDNSNQKLILELIDTLEIGVKSRLKLIIPMMYGGTTKSKQETINYLNRMTGVVFEVHDQFLKGSELAQFINTADIFIQAAKNDALSSSVLERLYAGNIVMTGEWLPYDRLRKDGFIFHEFNTFNFGVLFSKLISTLDYEKKRSSENKEIFRLNYDNKILGPKWLNVYKETVGA